MDKHVYIIIPTYREFEKAKQILDCIFTHIPSEALHVFMVNSNPGDETSALLHQLGKTLPVQEIAANCDIYWSGAVNLGLRRAMQLGTKNDYVLLMNADVTFHNNIIAGFDATVNGAENIVASALCLHDGNLAENGAQIISFLAAIHFHPFCNKPPDAIPQGFVMEMDFVPTRCFYFPMTVLHRLGVINERRLPHYAADYEFTHRIRRGGYRLLLTDKVLVNVDQNNTGFQAYRRKTSLWKRFQMLFHIKSNYNLRDRFWFIILTYPAYAWPSGLLISYIKIFFHVIFGEDGVQACRSCWKRSFVNT